MESAGRDRKAEKWIVGLLVAGWMAVTVFLTLTFIVLPQQGNPRSPASGRILDALWIAGMVGGPALAAVAAFLSLRTRRPDAPPSFVAGYSFALILLGALALAAGFANEIVIRDMESRRDTTVVPFLRFMEVHLFLWGGWMLAAGLLRNLRSRHAIPLTAGIHIVLVLWLPFGTAVAAWWFLKVRPKEDAAI